LRSADAKADRLPQLAQELVRLKGVAAKARRGGRETRSPRVYFPKRNERGWVRADCLRVMPAPPDIEPPGPSPLGFGVRGFFRARYFLGLINQSFGIKRLWEQKLFGAPALRDMAKTS
jgi:hypothetical protein